MPARAITLVNNLDYIPTVRPLPCPRKFSLPLFFLNSYPFFFISGFLFSLGTLDTGVLSIGLRLRANPSRPPTFPLD